jgi:hypothetical protein
VIVDLILYGAAFVLFLMHRYVSVKMKSVDVKKTDLGHVALAVVAANSLTVSPYGALASVMLTALYVIYQWWQDKSPKDIAVYTGAFAATVAAKFGISLTGL